MPNFTSDFSVTKHSTPTLDSQGPEEDVEEYDDKVDDATYDATDNDDEKIMIITFWVTILMTFQ